jgi:hypothetical protein
MARSSSRDPRHNGGDIRGKEATVRKALVAVILGIVVLAASVAPGSAATASLSAHFRGTSVFNFGSPCAFAHQTYSAHYSDGVSQKGRFFLDGCATLGSPNTYVGTFVLRPMGAPRLKGTVSGTISSSTATCPATMIASNLDFTMTPTVGNPIRLLGVWCSPGVPDVLGPIKGTITQP